MVGCCSSVDVMMFEEMLATLLVIILVEKAAEEVAGEDVGINTADDVLYHRQFVKSLYFWFHF